MKSTAEPASEKFLSGYNCAQSVLWAFAPRLNFDAEAALKIACGLGAGMGRRQEVCGAVTGGILALGLKFGRGSSDDRSVMEKAYAGRMFQRNYGSMGIAFAIGAIGLALATTLVVAWPDLSALRRTPLD